MNLDAKPANAPPKDVVADRTRSLDSVGSAATDRIGIRPRLSPSWTAPLCMKQRRSDAKWHGPTSMQKCSDFRYPQGIGSSPRLRNQGSPRSAANPGL
jgi:hypothetical protein